MRAFTDEEFRMMVTQLTDANGVSFEMLCRIAEKTLRPLVVHWCWAHGQHGYSDDVMQEIHIKLIKNCVTKFLFAKEGKLNDNPEEFNKWIFVVARNTTNTHLSKNGIRWKRITSIEEMNELFPEGYEIPDEEKSAIFEELIRLESMRGTIGDALEIIVSAKKKVYITLTWIAFMIKTLEDAEEKSKVSASIDRDFCSMTLFDMYKLLVNAASKIDWLEISEGVKDEIEQQLNESFDSKTTYGEATYNTFYMKKGPVATISDWINRANDVIIKKLRDEIKEALSL